MSKRVKHTSRYFVFEPPRRVIIFRRGAEPGASYWPDWKPGEEGIPWWSFDELIRAGGTEITRTKALRICKKLPK